MLDDLDYLTGITSDITSRNSIHPDGMKGTHLGPLSMPGVPTAACAVYVAARALFEPEQSRVPQ